mmetsp:Transcript_1869/g.5162  ORF Transcript_1869/g.5162 Transcript_1869/m.5162 type:complete len:174 (-) Transcript_1869:58-579(-)
MGGIDGGFLSTRKGGNLAVQWLASLIAFSCMASAGVGEEPRLQYFVAAGVMVWLLSMGLLIAFTLLGYTHTPLVSLEWQGPVVQLTGRLSLELIYYLVFTIMAFAAFVCGASGAKGKPGTAGAATFFMGLVLGTLGFGSFVEYSLLAEDADPTLLGAPPSQAPNAAVPPPTAY